MMSVQMNSGDILTKEKISELVGFIIDKFADEKLNADECEVILEATKDILGEYSIVQPYNFLSNNSCKE